MAIEAFMVTNLLVPLPLNTSEHPRVKRCVALLCLVLHFEGEMDQVRDFTTLEVALDVHECGKPLDKTCLLILNQQVLVDYGGREHNAKLDGHTPSETVHVVCVVQHRQPRPCLRPCNLEWIG